MFILALTLSLQFLCSINSVDGFQNVYGGELKPCSSEGMALTGYTRSGYCATDETDHGSHHICVDLSSTRGGNFCKVTGQPNWCSSSMPCHGTHDGTCPANKDCPIQHWCVCQWAFAAYIQKSGGCDQIQNVVCDAINLEALHAYRNYTSRYADALSCLQEKCGDSVAAKY